MTLTTITHPVSGNNNNDKNNGNCSDNMEKQEDETKNLSSINK